tara:strand:+ start:1530 stop:2327 length:798 start_codon:yes stop_codon:yes gene_type:complete
MNSITKKLKQELLSFDSIEERLNVLKDKFKGKKAIIIATGPTLADHIDDLKLLHNRDDIVILSVKQGYNYLKGQSDFHITSTYNFDKYKGYDYEDIDNTIIFYGLSKSYIPQQMAKLAIKPHPCDIWVPIVNPPFITYEECIHMGNYDKMLLLRNTTEPQGWWGTSILWEQAIPMALLLGCKDIVTLGWDATTGEHVWDALNKKVSFKVDSGTVGSDNDQKLKDVLENAHCLYDFCKKEGINLNIISDKNQFDPRIPKLKSIKEI